MNRIFYLLFIISFISCKPDFIPKKYEMRGVWVASVKNIDWPTRPQYSARALKDDFRKIAAFHQQNGMNAMIVQVRPATDAMYKSETEPWSQWLTGEQGISPEPSFDPLDFMIEEAHNRGMEFHAWFNPYRAIVDFESTQTSLNHITRIRPGWFVEYGDNMYFNPGIPEAREYLVEVIAEVVRNYDLDAIHFDDYFYPYKIAGIEFPDSVSFTMYGRDFSSVENWRRDNVNRLIRELNTEIKSINPFVKFGISPFGVWRNSQVDPLGSDSRAGQTNYDDLYADVRLWLKNEWIDYVVPQIYWHIGFNLADYEKLVEWWSDNSYGRQLFIGQAAYKIGSDRAEEWQNPSEMLSHLRMNDKYQEVLGDVYFSSRSFDSNPLGLTDSLRSDRYKFPALIPPMPWIDDTAPSVPEVLPFRIEEKGVYFQWMEMKDNNPGYTLIYRAKGNKSPDITDPRNIIAKLRHPINSYHDKELIRSGTYTYLITHLDRNNNESPASTPFEIKIR